VATAKKFQCNVTSKIVNEYRPAFSILHLYHLRYARAAAGKRSDAIHVERQYEKLAARFGTAIATQARAANRFATPPAKT
jgi:hypothetical protein